MAEKADSGRMKFLAADDELLLLEQEKLRAGFRFVVGIDEVGRGPLAGPVVAAAVGDNCIGNKSALRCDVERFFGG